MGTPQILVLLVVAAMMLFGSRSLDKIREAIENFRDNFPGGPPRPMHPSPVNDRALLRRRLRSRG